MAKKLRNVAYATESDCIADLENLRRGNRAGGNWTLEQACFHLGAPLGSLAKTSADPTPKQAKLQEFLQGVLVNGWPDATLPTPPETNPPKQVGREAVDTFIVGLNRLAQQPDGRVDAPVFGPVEMSRLRRFFLIHAAHHLNFFEPAART